MPRAAVMLVIPSHVSRLKPLHPATQIAVTPRPDHQMKVVGHQAVGQHAHRATNLRLVKQPHKRRVVRLLVKHPLPPVSPVENVVAIAGWRAALGAWHARTLYTAASSPSINKPDPFISPYLPNVGRCRLVCRAPLPPSVAERPARMARAAGSRW